MRAYGPGATPSFDQAHRALGARRRRTRLSAGVFQQYFLPLAVGVTTTWGWTLFVPGLIALLVSLLGAWVIQQSRDKSLR